MKELTMNLREHQGVITVSFSGEITGEADFSEITNKANAGKAVCFDLGEVARINSWGVQKWLALLSQLNENHTPFSFQRCSVPMIHHFNDISGFTGGGRIESILIPYYCDHCDLTHDHLVLIQKMGELPDLPDIRCPSCAIPMAFDDIPEIFFRFLCTTSN
jgi:hypothetical protein